jgi:uncharacterized protein (DUF1499 family)
VPLGRIEERLGNADRESVQSPRSQSSLPARSRGVGSFALRWGLVLAVASLVILLLGPVGTRLGLWTFVTGFSLLRWSVYVALGACALAVLGGLLTRRWLPAVVAVVLSLAVAGLPYSWLRTARRLPPIHDITTDTASPPEFVAILAQRRDAPNPPSYDRSAAPMQKRAYADIRPLNLRVPADHVFGAALDTARGMGWQIVAADPAQGRIEATDTTFWFGFKDDVVIRVASTADGSRVDVRSVSRVGRSDVGTNAARIRSYIAELSRRLAKS